MIVHAEGISVIVKQEVDYATVAKSTTTTHESEHFHFGATCRCNFLI